MNSMNKGRTDFRQAALTLTGTLTTTVDATNSGTDKVPVRDPYLGLRACIAVEGVFPSRP